MTCFVPAFIYARERQKRGKSDSIFQLSSQFGLVIKPFTELFILPVLVYSSNFLEYHEKDWYTGFSTGFIGAARSNSSGFSLPGIQLCRGTQDINWIVELL